MSTSSNQLRRVLLVGFVDSAHLGKWVRNNSIAGVEFWIFPAGPNRRIDSGLKHAFLSEQLMVSWFEILISPLLSITELLDKKSLLRGMMLKRRIRKFQPHVVHLFETQHSGYAMASAGKKGNLQQGFKTVLTLFGSDLYWFSRLSSHKSRLKITLDLVDYIHFECKRDIDLARSLGFDGRFLGPYPASGVITSYIGANGKNSDERNLILAKGYTSPFGQGDIILKSFIRLWRQGSTNANRFIFYSASFRLRISALIARLWFGLPVTAYAKFKLSSDQMALLMGQARVHVGVSKSDGIPAAFVEALAMGARPIQSSTACISDLGLPGGSFDSVADVDPESLALQISLAWNAPVSLDEKQNTLRALEDYWDRNFISEIYSVYLGK